jgi:hypothetical protein
MSRSLLIIHTLLASWLGMQQVHELGHVIGAWLTGGRVEQVVLHPLTISRTDLAENPHPMLVVWAGPVVGVALPLAAWLAAVACRLRQAFLLRFFAGFCLVANGLYIGVGWIDSIGDAGDMLRLGAAPGLLVAFGVATTGGGFLLWHKQGRHFGLGPHALPVERAAIVAVIMATGVTLLTGLLIGGR